MKIKNIITLSVVLCLLSHCTTQSKTEKIRPKTVVPIEQKEQKQAQIGAASAGHANIKCISTARCEVQEEGFDVPSICVSMVAKIGEDCGTIANIECENSAFCKTPTKYGLDNVGPVSKTLHKA